MESLFHSMRRDVYHGYLFTQEKALQRMVSDYLAFYNNDRINTSFGSRTPAQFEQQCAI